jgi:hypothetical protein
VRGRLVGHHVDLDATPEQLGENLGAVADQPNAQRPLRRLRGRAPLDRVVEVVGDLVEVAVLDAAAQACLVDVHHQADAAVERHGQRLRAAHAAAAAGQRDRARQRPSAVRQPASGGELGGTAANVS